MKNKQLRPMIIRILLSAIILTFINIIPSFAADSIKYYYDNGNRLIRSENLNTGTVTEYQYDESGSRTQKGVYAPLTITATAGTNGAISPAGTFAVPYKSDIVFAITPNDGYHIVDVLVDGVSAGAVTSYNFTGITANHIIASSFTTEVDETNIDGKYYPSIQAAYNAASSGATIKVAARSIVENLNVNRNISVNLEGGYNSNYTGITGVTNLKGMISTWPGGGTITIKNFNLQNQ
jgi:YD repeat-containing protein